MIVFAEPSTNRFLIHRESKIPIRIVRLDVPCICRKHPCCDSSRSGQHLAEAEYCKSLIFSVPLYLANLANLTFSLIFKDAKLKRRQQYFSTLK